VIFLIRNTRSSSAEAGLPFRVLLDVGLLGTGIKLVTDMSGLVAAWSRMLLVKSGHTGVKYDYITKGKGKEN